MPTFTAPNFPIMLGSTEQPKMLDEKTIIPVQAYGVKIISMGLLNPGDKPLICAAHAPQRDAAIPSQRALGPARLSDCGFAARHR